MQRAGSCKWHLDTKQNLLPEGLFRNRQESSSSATLRRALRDLLLPDSPALDGSYGQSPGDQHHQDDPAVALQPTYLQPRCLALPALPVPGWHPCSLPAPRCRRPAQGTCAVPQQRPPVLGQGCGGFLLRHPPLLPLHWLGMGMRDLWQGWKWSKRDVPPPQGNPSSKTPQYPFVRANLGEMDGKDGTGRPTGGEGSSPGPHLPKRKVKPPFFLL